MTVAARDRRCDVLIVGGGPAGSSCAWRLARAGVDVLVLDRAEFPRDKVCAGWITPAVCDALALDLDDYARGGRTLQAFTGFRTGGLDGPLRVTDFGTVVSYGIRRCELDHYLLQRSGARLVTGQPLTSLERTPDGWIANGSIHASMIVGAGGHFCPVARQLNPGVDEERVVAQEVEYRLPPEMAGACQVRGEWPDLFFWPDLQGYGWCVRKGDYLNVGAGRLSEKAFPAAVRAFQASLEARGLVPPGLPAKWKGHAYVLYRNARRALCDDRAVLIGDAAGVALAPSGEGILAAVETGLLAADAIVRTSPDYSRASLDAYARSVDARFGPRLATRAQPSSWPSWLAPLATRALLNVGWLTRRVLIEDGFLHKRRRAIAQ
jgi:flavin-dependent dehydrogenase